MRSAPLLLAFLALAALFAPLRAQPGSQPPPDAVTARVTDARRPGPPPGLDYALWQLSNAAAASPSAGAAGSEAAVAAQNDLRLEDGLVQVELFYRDRAAAEQAITAAGGHVTVRSAYTPALQTWLDPATLTALLANPAVAALHRPQTVEPVEATAGSALSEGLAALNGPVWHAAGQDGTGVTIAIIDAGFIGYADLLGSDLPETVTLKNFVDGQSDAQAATGTSHGTGVAEIVFDVAPGAELLLIKISTNLDLQQAVSYAIDAGADIISTSLIWYNVTPGDGTGQFAELVALARDNGILWVTAAGNDRERHWGGAFSDGDGDGWHQFNGAQEINFFTSELPAGTTVSAYLRWNDWQSSGQDLDLYLMRYDVDDEIWYEVARSASRQSGGFALRPVEALSFRTTADSAIYGLLVYGHTLTRPVDFDLFAARMPRLDEYVTARSLGNLADAPLAITSAAIHYANPFSQRVYSAEGPTNGSGGSAGTDGSYPKPEIAAYDRVDNITYGSFGGTSAAAPHVAGAAALVLNAYPDLTPSELEVFLFAGALDLGPAGFDTDFGHGRLFLPDIFAALNATVTIQGRTDLAVPLRVTLYPPGSTTPAYQFAPTPGSDGAFTLGGILPGEYQVAVKAANTLQVVQELALSTGSNSQPFGPLPAGDTNNDNRVSGVDFSLLAATFNLSSGDANYDGRADFSGDNRVSAVDFSLLAGNYNTFGQEPSG